MLTQIYAIGRPRNENHDVLIHEKGDDVMQMPAGTIDVVLTTMQSDILCMFIGLLFKHTGRFCVKFQKTRLLGACCTLWLRWLLVTDPWLDVQDSFGCSDELQFPHAM